MRNSLLAMLMLLVFFGCRKTDFPDKHNTTPPAALSISPDSIRLNPTGFAPLSAILSYSYIKPGKTKIIVVGKHGANSNIENEFNDYGTSHSVPIIGLYANFNNSVEIILFSNTGDSLAKAFISIQTGALPASMVASITIDSAQYSSMEPGVNLVSSFSSTNPMIPYMVDNYGDIRWLLDYTTQPDLHTLYYDDGISRLRNGNFYFADINSIKIYEVDFFGTIVNSWGLGGYGFHHEVREMPNGDFLVSATKPSSTHTEGTPTVEDYVIEISRQTGQIVNTWDLKESLDEYRTTLAADPVDWIHINAVYYDSTDNTIIVSGRTQGVVKLDFNNRVKWILGPHKGWGVNRRGEDLNQFLLTPLDAHGNKITDTSVINGYTNHPDFEWNWYQHSTIMIPDGNLMLFDNGSTRNYDYANANNYSRAVEYKIDSVNMTVQQIWEYGKERGISTFSLIVSSVQFLPETNHVLFCPGYQVQNANGQGGKIIEVDYATKQEVFQASISSPSLWGFHRTKRISAYP